jgi:hypothetical protein
MGSDQRERRSDRPEVISERAEVMLGASSQNSLSSRARVSGKVFKSGISLSVRSVMLSHESFVSPSHRTSLPASCDASRL